MSKPGFRVSPNSPQGFDLDLDLGHGLYDPDELLVAFKASRVTASQYLNLLRAMQSVERIMPGSRFYWPELSEWMREQTDKRMRIRLAANGYGELRKKEVKGRKGIQSLRYVPIEPDLAQEGAYRGYELLTEHFEGHQRLLAKHGIPTSYVIVLEGKAGRPILVPVDTIKEIDFLP